MSRVRPLYISEGAIRRSVDNLPIPICFEDFGGEGRTHVDHGSEVVTEHRVVIRECHWLITKHDPVIESEFTDLADIGLVGGLCLVQRTATTKGLNYLPLVG